MSTRLWTKHSTVSKMAYLNRLYCWQFYLVLFGVLLGIDFPFSSRTVYIQMQTECLAKKKKYTRRQWNDCVFWASMIFSLSILWQSIDFCLRISSVFCTPQNSLAFGLEILLPWTGLLLSAHKINNNHRNSETELFDVPFN